MRRMLLSVTAVCLVAGFIATPGASAQQSVNFFLGGFVPTSADARGDASGGSTNDVLVSNQSFLAFRLDGFKGATVGGEYLAGLGNFFEAGAGVGFYQRTVPAVDINYVNPGGSNIAADLKLRIVPFNATFRVLPFGHNAPIVPVGRNPPIFNGTVVGSGTAVGPVILGGIRVPIGPVAPGFEVRYQGGKGTLPGDQSFSATKIDLGGMNYLFTFNIRF